MVQDFSTQYNPFYLHKTTWPKAFASDPIYVHIFNLYMYIIYVYVKFL